VALGLRINDLVEELFGFMHLEVLTMRKVLLAVFVRFV
jgi:hypothetical protein